MRVLLSFPNRPPPWVGVVLVLLGLAVIYVNARPWLPVWAGLVLVLALVGIAGLLITLNIFWAGDSDLWLVPAISAMVGISVFLAGLYRGGVVPLLVSGMLTGAQVVGLFAYLAYKSSGRAGDLLAWTALALAAVGWAWTAVSWNAPRSPGRLQFPGRWTLSSRANRLS